MPTQAMGRSTEVGVADRFRFGRFELHRTERRLLVDGAPAGLGARSFDLLLALVERPGRTVSKSELLDEVWPGLVVEEANVQVQVSALRKVLGHDTIATIGGVGYRLAVPVDSFDSPPHHALPAERNSFIGREAVLQTARGHLGHSRLLTLVGMGGIGKTRLAMRLAETAGPGFRHGARWTDLAPLTSAESLETALADALGCRLQGQGGPLAALVAHCQGSDMLLVLDNCEHLMDAVRAAVDALLAGAPKLRILVTSREALGLAGEQLLPIRPLELPAPGSDASAVLRTEAVSMFIDRATSCSPGLVFDTRMAPVLSDICKQLDGVPLALELAANRLRLVSVSQLQGLLGERLELISGGPRALPRQASLQAVIRWSYEAAGPLAQQCLCALSVCAGGCDLQALKALLGPGPSTTSIADALSQLCDLGLISVDRRDTHARWSLLETVGQYALERLRESGQLDALQDRHCEHYLQLAEQADWHRRGVSDRIAIDRLRDEHDNLMRAMERCGAAASPTLGLRFAVALRSYWATRGLLRLGRDLTQQALARKSTSEDDALRSAAARSLAQLHWWLGEAHLALGPAQEALMLAERLHAVPLMGQAHRTLSYVHGLLGRLDLAGLAAQAALRLARQQGDPVNLAAALHVVADHCTESGEPARAEVHFEEAYRVRVTQGDLEGQGSSALALADIAIECHALDRARHWLRIAGERESQTHSSHIGQHLVECSARLASLVGEHALALRWYSASARQRVTTGLSALTMSHPQRVAAIRRATNALGPAAASVAEQEGAALSEAQTVHQVNCWLSPES